MLSIDTFPWDKLVAILFALVTAAIAERTRRVAQRSATDTQATRTATATTAGDVTSLGVVIAAQSNTIEELKRNAEEDTRRYTDLQSKSIETLEELSKANKKIGETQDLLVKANQEIASLKAYIKELVGVIQHHGIQVEPYRDT